MLQIIMSKYRELNERAQQREYEARLNNSIARYQSEAIDNQFIDTEVKSGSKQFDPYLYSTSDALSESEHLSLLRNSIKLYNTDGYVHGWIELFVNFTVGSECRIKMMDDDPATQETWDEYAERENFILRAQETARRFYREGEFFKRFFVNKINGDVYSRFLNPLHIASNGQNNTSFGITTSSDDIEDVIAYYYSSQQNGSYKAISASEVQHGKRSDSDMKRGRPLITPILPHIIELNKLLKARQFFHRIRASVIIEEKIKNASPAIIAAMDKRASTQPPIGGIFRHNDGIEREYKTPNLQAADADVDIRRQILKIATSLQIAEFMATGDASNANMASQLIAESPAVKTFSTQQVILGRYFMNEARRVIQAKIDKGELSKTSFETITTYQNGIRSVSSEVVPRSLSSHVEFPQLIHREPLVETNALVLQRTQGWISDRTAQIHLNLDPENEKNQIEEEINSSVANHGTMDTPQNELSALDATTGLPTTTPMAGETRGQVGDSMLGNNNPAMQQSQSMPQKAMLKQAPMSYYAKKLYKSLKRKTASGRAKGQ